jgi:hypothetical protein
MIQAMKMVVLDREPSGRTFTLGSQEHLEIEQEQWKAGRRARDYYSGNPKQREERVAFLTESGMTEAELYAQAFECKSETLQIFERMIAARERTRRRLRKEDARRRRDKARETDRERAGGRIDDGQ